MAIPQLRINADLPEANIGLCCRVGSSQQRHRRLGHCRFLRRRGFEVVGVGDLFAFGNGSLWVRHDFDEVIAFQGIDRELEFAVLELELGRDRLALGLAGF
jgi:hypothetical protein